MMKILITGAAGFIGFNLSKKLLSEGYEVVGIDNLNDYYEVTLKENRLKEITNHNFSLHQIDLENREEINDIFESNKPDVVINLAAQAGVRYSLENPHAYIESNIVGFVNILEACRHNNVEQLIYASSTSAYVAGTSPA